MPDTVRFIPNMADKFNKSKTKNCYDILKENYMFDTAKFYSHMTNLVYERLLDKSTLNKIGTKLYGDTFYLKHPFGLDNPQVFIDWEERTLCLEASLPKLFQGHNVFGTNRLEFLCLATIELIYKQLGLTFTSHERRAVREHRFRLGRLDTTCSFLLDSSHQVAEALEAIMQQLRAEGRDWSAYGTHEIETVYNQQNSTRVADKFYNKHVELLRKKLHVGVAERDWILSFVRKLLRFEVTWRGRELKELELEYADLWSPQLLKQLMQQRLEKFNFQGVIKDELYINFRSDAPKASPNLFYDLWTQGARLGSHFRNRTLDRARDHLLKHRKIDIYRPAKTGCDIPLKKILTADNAYFTAPKYLTRRGAIFGIGGSNSPVSAKESRVLAPPLHLLPYMPVNCPIGRLAVHG